MEKLNLANLPTRIEKLKFTQNDIEVYIKRDDQTGYELSGNKVRKLEYSLKEALEQESTAIITCGGIQSNHARATAIASVKLGLEVHLVLKDNEKHQQGNYFMNQMIGANIHIITVEAYKNRHQIMNELKEKLDAQGKKAYIIPEGASNGIGNLGYMHCYEEIKIQGYTFDYIAAAYGSGSTHTGLLLGKKFHNDSTKIIGYNIYNPDVDSFKMVSNLAMESETYISVPPLSKEDVIVYTDYVGRGYALSTTEEIEFIKNFAREEGVLLDTVYTGKAMYGLISDIKKGLYPKGSKILFIHTGGFFGNFSKIELFN